MILFNKTMMCGGLVVLAPGSPLQVLFAILIMLFHLLFVLKLAPFAKDSEDWSAFLATLGLCLMSLGAYSMMIDVNEAQMNIIGLVTTVLPLVCIVAVVSIMVLFDSGLWHSVRREKSGTQIVPVGLVRESSTLRKSSLIQDEYNTSEMALKAEQEKRQQRQHQHTQARLKARLKIKTTRALTKVPLFQQVSSEGIDSILDATTYRKAFLNEVLCAQGEEAAKFYIIVSGRCSVSVQGKELERQVGTLKELDYFGESVLCGGEALRNATVTVRSGAVEVLALSRPHFDKLIEEGIVTKEMVASVVEENQRRREITFETTMLSKDEC